jgi:hypothetical protein
MSIKGRVMKVETSLTPKQTVLLWLAEARKQTLTDYSREAFHRGETGRDRVQRLMSESMDKVTKGMDRHEAHRLTRQAILDADLLVCAVLESNKVIVENARTDALQAALLASQIKGILEADSVSNEMQRIFGYLSFEAAYPLDPATADAYRWMAEQWVQPDDIYRYDLEDWVRAHFIQQGKRRVPADVAGFFEGRRPLTDAELLQHFDSPEAVAAFRRGEDYTHGLADVRDADFERLMEAIDADVQALVKKKTLKTGTGVHVELPTDATWFVPLVEGAWFDRTLAELLELNTLLEAEGWQSSHPDSHNVAWHAYQRPSADGGDTGERLTLDAFDARRDQMRVTFDTFKGKTRTLQGRTLLSFADIQAWTTRRSKPLKTATGITSASWRAWIDAHGGPGTATLAGVPVGYFSTLPDGDYYAVEDDDERRTKQNDRLLLFDRLRPWLVNKAEVEGREYITSRHRDEVMATMLPFGLMGFKTRIADWRVRAMAHASEVFRSKAAIAQIQTKHFEGQTVLFPDVEQDLARQIQMLEEVVAVFNDTLAQRLRMFSATELLTGEQPADDDRELPAPLRTGFEINLAEVEKLVAPYVAARVEEIMRAARVRVLEAANMHEELRRELLKDMDPQGDAHE